MIIFEIYLRENDVAAIDINMGCPKEFSVQVNLNVNAYSLHT